VVLAAKAGGDNLVIIFETAGAVPADFGPSAIAIGKFDGMHAGHRTVIDRLKAVAADEGLAAVAVTFDRNPLSTVRPELCPVSLLSNNQKLELLDETGLDATLMLVFDKAFSELSPAEFIRSIIVEALHARVVFVGADFRFGAKGAGTVDVLRAEGDVHGFRVEVIDEVTAAGARRASSTWVRELLEEGKVREAAEVLGRPPSIRSIVVGGEQRGRKLGYPTANLSRDVEGFIPADGVYAARLTVDGVSYGAAVSVGNNPTFEGVPDKQVEAHALDQTLDLYGKSATLEFIEYIRPMNKFENADALVAQMNADEVRIRSILGIPKPS
jgi:riboflavin kinase / FMN adenylyltransferase